MRCSWLRPLVALAIAFAVTPVALGAQYGPSDLTSRFDVRVDGPGISGAGAIGLRNSGDAPMSTVWLRLWGNGGYGCSSAPVHVTVTSGGTGGSLAKVCTALPVRLAQPLAPGATTTIGVSLRGRVPADNWRTGSWRAIHSFGGMLPTVAPIVNGRVDLDRYIAVGDPWLLLTGSWHVTLTTRSGVRVATSGVAGDPLPAATGWVRREYVNDTGREFNIVTGASAVLSGDADGVPVRVFSGPATTAKRARALLGTAIRAVQAFSARYGPYPSAHLDVVLVGTSGMEYPSLVLSEPTVLTLTHEIAHQWFSQEVGSDGWKEPWIDETMATYAQMRLLGLTADCSLTNPLGSYRPARLSWTLAQFARYPDRLYDVVYDGGACALAGVAHDIGGAAFDTLLGDWVAAHQGGVVTTGEFLDFLRTRIPDATMARFLATTGLG